MFIKLFPNLLNNKIVKIINEFYSSIFYLVLIGIFTFVSCLFGIEIQIYIATLVVSCLIPVFLCDDMLSVLAPVSMYYCTFSLKKNNTIEHKSVFSDQTFVIQLIIVASIIAFFLLFRLLFDLIKKREKFGFPRLMIGFAVLGLFYIISGFGSKYFEVKSVLIGGLEFITICITYFYLFYSVNWKKLKFDYVLKMMVVFGFVLFSQIIGSIIMNSDVVSLVGRGKIVTGWGIHTNIGGMMCLCVPVPFYFITKSRKPFLNGVFAIIFMFGVTLTCSRGPILTASILFVLCMIIVLIKASNSSKCRMLFSFVVGVALGFGVLRLMGFDVRIIIDNFSKFIFDIQNLDDYSTGRLSIYKDGFAKFAEYPILGTGWLTCTAPKFTQAFFPARWHNTIVQTLATGGVLLLLSYLYHRFETLRLLFKNDKKVPLNKAFLYLPILALIISSMFDCFMFNLGPGLIYGVLLVTIEKGEDDSLTLFSGNKQLVSLTN